MLLSVGLTGNTTYWNLIVWFSRSETVHLRLGLELTCQDSNPAKTHSLPTEVTHLVSGLNEAQVLDVSLQKEFSERQSDR